MSSSPRRYSDAELRRILARAAAADSEAGSSSSSADGHTLAEIREVAREAGIDPAGVDRAAAALEPPAATHVFLGFPLTFQKEAVLPHRLTRGQMLSITREADRLLGGAGTVSEGDGWLQWHNEQKRTFVGMVRSTDATRVRVISDQAHAFIAGVGAIGLTGSILTMNVLFNLGGAGDLLIAAGMGVGTYGGMRLYWSQRCRGAVTRMQRMLDAVHAQVRNGDFRSSQDPADTEPKQESGRD